MINRLVFMSASIKTGERLNEIMRIYGDCSGQSVNRKKSSTFSQYSRSLAAECKVSVWVFK
jgi:hypothetical protein